MHNSGTRQVSLVLLAIQKLCRLEPAIVPGQGRLLFHKGSLLVSAASIARRVYMRKNLGVGNLRVHYGGRNKRKGVVPEHFAKASGGLIRHILKQLGMQTLLP